jgi:hypothetical protein
MRLGGGKAKRLKKICLPWAIFAVLGPPCNNLENALQTHFEQLGSSKDLDEAIDLHCQALALCPPPHPDHSSSLNNLSNALQTCFEQLGFSKDLGEAIDLNCQALALHPLSHPTHFISLNNLARAL